MKDKVFVMRISEEQKKLLDKYSKKEDTSMAKFIWNCVIYRIKRSR